MKTRLQVNLTGLKYMIFVQVLFDKNCGFEKGKEEAFVAVVTK